jgi:hypothetical protein
VSSAPSHDPAAVNFLFELGEIAAAGGDVRTMILGA